MDACGARVDRRPALPRAAWPVAFVLLLAGVAAVAVACEPTVDDRVAELAAGRAGESTRQALLLAKERAVLPLLAALAAQPDPALRDEIARLLASLMMRTEDGRIEAALVHLLRDDPAPAVRAAVARQLGLQRRPSAVPALVAALEDPDGSVRQEALVALGPLQGRWGERADQIREAVRRLARDPHKGARVEAMVLLSGAVQERLQSARQAALAGDLARAESILVTTLEFAPGDRRAAYDLGRHYLDEGDVPRGQEFLRTHGMLLDVPALAQPPRVDGRLDEPVWQKAAHIDSLWQLSQEHEAALPTDLRTDLYGGWRPEGLYIGVVCWDEATGDLVVGVQHDDDNADDSWREDRLEVFLDPQLSHDRFVELAVNSIGAKQDGSASTGGADFSFDWDAEGEWAATVGPDRWSAEVLLRFGPQLPRPQAGRMWGANLVRCYRGQEFVQWTRTTHNASRPDQFGVFLFR